MFQKSRLFKKSLLYSRMTNIQLTELFSLWAEGDDEEVTKELFKQIWAYL